MDPCFKAQSLGQFHVSLVSLAVCCTAQEDIKEGEGDKVRSEFAAIDEQLNSVERYAMRYLEEENAGVAAEQLKQAEVTVYNGHTQQMSIYELAVNRFATLYSVCSLYMYMYK